MDRKGDLEALKQLREDIDLTDDKLIELLNKRASIVKKIGKIKSEQKLQFHTPEREESILKRLSNKKGLLYPIQSIRSIFREILNASLSLEEGSKVLFLGPEASFTHEACKQHFSASANLQSRMDIKDIFEDVSRGNAEFGVIPIENSTEGTVTYALDMFMDYDVKISSEILLRISLHLISDRAEFEDVKELYSHPQAIAQCRAWISRNLSNASIKEASSTAYAVRMVKGRGDSAAIAGTFAADLYGMRVIRPRINDIVNNFTRFLVIGRSYPGATGDDKTSILFSVKDEPGGLYRTLKPLAEKGINMSRIESRPLKGSPWEYIFFVDMDGHISRPPISSAIELLENQCIFIKHLGSYPKAGESI